jgi:hypothetical protein
VVWRLVGGTTVSRAPEGCVGPGRPNGVGLVRLIHKPDGLTLSKMDTDTHTRESMHHTPRILSSRACYTGASNSAGASATVGIVCVLFCSYVLYPELHRDIHV